MLIHMLQTRRGSEDGISCRQYHKGEKYEVADSLACHFLKQGWAYNAEDDYVPFNHPDYLNILLAAIKPPTKEQMERICK